MRFLLTIVVSVGFLFLLPVGSMAEPPVTKTLPVHHNCRPGSHWDAKAGKCLPDIEKEHKVIPPIKKEGKVIPPITKPKKMPEPAVPNK